MFIKTKTRAGMVHTYQMLVSFKTLIAYKKKLTTVLSPWSCLTNYILRGSSNKQVTYKKISVLLNTNNCKKFLLVNRPLIRLQNLLKMYREDEYLQKYSSWQYVFKMSSKRFEDVLIKKHFSQNILIIKISIERIQDVLIRMNI